jgi:hypothetical protein
VLLNTLPLNIQPDNVTLAAPIMIKIYISIEQSPVPVAFSAGESGDFPVDIIYRVDLVRVIL